VRITEIDVAGDRRTASGGAITAPNGGTTGIGRHIARHHRTRGNECGNYGKSRRHAPSARVMHVNVGEVVRRRVHGERT
jgi:hypothetical protein